MQQRIKRHPYLALFDGADPNSSSAERSSSTTPLQALFLMNNESIHHWSAAFARRLAGFEETAAIQEAYWNVLGRPARLEEVRDGSAYLNNFAMKASGSPTERRALAWASFGRCLLASDEFIYVD
jgi:hypothetical protein